LLELTISMLLSLQGTNSQNQDACTVSTPILHIRPKNLL
jgi:hypothetical protein